MKSLSRRDRAVVAVFVVAQVVVASFFFASRWIEEGSHPVTEHRYSWQMYSTAGGETTYVGSTETGETVELSLEELPPVVRGVSYDYSVPRMLCEKNPGLVSVTRVAPEEGLEKFTEPLAC